MAAGLSGRLPPRPHRLSAGQGPPSAARDGPAHHHQLVSPTDLRVGGRHLPCSRPLAERANGEGRPRRWHSHRLVRQGRRLADQGPATPPNRPTTEGVIVGNPRCRAAVAQPAILGTELQSRRRSIVGEPPAAPAAKRNIPGIPRTTNQRAPPSVHAPVRATLTPAPQLPLPATAATVDVLRLPRSPPSSLG